MYEKDKDWLIQSGTFSAIGGVVLGGLVGFTPVNLFAVGAGVSMVVYDAYDKGRPYKKLLMNCGIINKEGSVPKFKKKRETRSGHQLIFSLPSGLSTDEVIKKQSNIEQHLNKKVNIHYKHKQIIIDVFENDLKSLYGFEITETNSPTKIITGYSLGDMVEIIDLKDAPHLLIAGESGGGKSTTIRTIITNLILTKDVKDLELDLIDLKMGAEFSIFKDCEIVSSFSRTIEEAGVNLNNILNEVQRRYDLFYQKNCVDITEYNERFKTNKLKNKIIVIDEYAELMHDKEVQKIVERICAISRASGIHVILSTQRPDKDVVNGRIKANIPTVIGLKTATGINSRVVFDKEGLENLKGKGNGIVKYNGREVEIQSPYLSPQQARKLLKDKSIGKAIKEPKKNTGAFTKSVKANDGEVVDFDFLNKLGDAK